MSFPISIVSFDIISSMEKMNRDRIPNPGKMQAPEYGSIRLDISTKSIRLKGSTKSEHLSDSEYQVLWYLVRAQGSLITEGELSTFLYEDIPDNRDIPIGNNVAVFLNRAREKLERLTKNKMTIGSVRGLGYCVEEVSK